MNRAIDVIILEDNIDEFRLIKRQLEKSELVCNIIHTEKLDEFESFLSEKLPDLVLSDYNLSSFTGEDILEILRKRSEILPFILVSGAIGEKKAVEIMRKGANDFVSKNTLHKLIPTVKRTLEEFNNKAELQKYKTKLEESNKQLENFAYIVSHDLKEPLRMVRGFIDLFEKKSKDKADEECKQYIQFIKDGAKRMDALIQSILDFSRINTQGAEFEIMNMNEAISGIIHLFDKELKNKNGSISSDVLPQITADKLQIVQLFQNLIGNSLKFIKEGVPPKIEISAEENSDEWIFKIKDNGIGIDDKHKDRIFDMFRRLHSTEKYEGTGIGLAFCKQIVKRHGGEIWFESEPEKGSTFIFTIKKRMC